MSFLLRRNLPASSAALGGVLATSVATPGPRNAMRDRRDPDLLNPLSTDSGTLPNLDQQATQALQARKSPVVPA